MHLLTWFGLLLIALGTASTIIGQQKLNDISNAQLQKKSDEIANLSQENLKLAELNTELSQQSLNQITGGDSWAHISSGIHTANGIANQPFLLVLNHVGEHPLYDLKVKMFEVVVNVDTPTKSYDLTQIFEKEVGTLNRTIHPEHLDIFQLPDKNRVDYLVKLNARNGEITQHWIFIKNKNNCWSTAKKVSKLKPNKDGSFSNVELRQEIDPDFPDKSIEWFGF